MILEIPIKIFPIAAKKGYKMNFQNQIAPAAIFEEMIWITFPRILKKGKKNLLQTKTADFPIPIKIFLNTENKNLENLKIVFSKTQEQKMKVAMMNKNTKVKKAMVESSMKMQDGIHTWFTA